MFTVVTIVAPGRWDVFNGMLLQSINEGLMNGHVDGFIAIEGKENTNIAREYNSMLLAARYSKREYLVFAHYDIGFTVDFWESAQKNLESEAAVVGLIGVTKDGHVSSSGTEEETEVSTLDSCLMGVRTDNPFLFDDKMFNGLHLYGEDYCCHARHRGQKVMVVPCEKHAHIGATFHKEGPQWRTYNWYKERLMAKWSKMDVFTT